MSALAPADDQPTLTGGPRPSSFALRQIPCANVGSKDALGCPNEGSKACTSCSLAKYCSKECQLMHWKAHKKECKGEFARADWKPHWIRERRSPSFMLREEETMRDRMANIHPLGQGISLWGNMPAQDILNIPNNEGSAPDDLAVAFIASGDLRNVIRTVNELPANYSGNLTILLNDRDPHVALRNLLLILVLGKVSNKDRAADIALHFWYSAFVPADYAAEVNTLLAELIVSVRQNNSRQSDQSNTSLPPQYFVLSDTSSLSGHFMLQLMGLLLHILSSQYEASSAAEELQRVLFAPSRVDERDRYLWMLEPSHRLSVLKFRKSGVLLPFGASTAAYDTTNRFLFTPSGLWLQSDSKSPLDSWDIPTAIEAGKARGATRADMFGCLYFYLSDQLREFATRLSRFRVAFKSFNMDATDLADFIRMGLYHTSCEVPPSVRFDRIEVSNIVDREYVGLEGVCRDWGGMLKDTTHATLVGYFMNWITQCNDGVPNHAMASAYTRKLIAQGRLSFPTSGEVSPEEMLAKVMILSGSAFSAMYDNSRPFRAFLDKQGLQEVLHREKLRLKKKHTIVPRRIAVPLEGSPTALPVFRDNNEWYLKVHVMGQLWSERYIELSRA